MRLARLLAVVLLLGPALSAPVGAEPMTLTDPARVTALAVSVDESGNLVGTNASIEVRVSPNGSGHVFMDTRPLSALELQGSARIAARVAAGITGHGLQAHDFFVKVRSDQPLVSGPSAGAIMTLASVVALENAHADGQPWEIREDVMATGTINPDGSVGPVGGILEKARAAEDAGAEVFLVPAGEANYTPRLPPEKEAYGEAAVNVPDFCERELNITCRAMGTVEELVETATGRELPQPELGEPPTTALYADELGPRTREIVDRSARVFDTWEQANDTSMPADAREIVDESASSAVDSHQAAERLWEQDRFYSAASKAFQASIREQHARLLTEFFEGDRDRAFLEETVDRAREDVREARQAAQQAEATDLHTLYTVGAGQDRVSEAERRLEEANSALDRGSSASQVLVQTAWAFERARTVHWWLDLGEAFVEGPALPEGAAPLADDFVNLARELVTYAEAVAGTSAAADVNQARQLLRQARSDSDRGFHAAALVESAEAQVVASLALEGDGDQLGPEKVNASRHQAAVSIQKARGLDAEPILPVAMFEFASTSEDPSTAIRFYRTANVLAGLSSTLTADEEPSPSRFVDPGEDGEDHSYGQIQGDQLGVATWSVVGALAALALLTLIGVIRRRGD